MPRTANDIGGLIKSFEDLYQDLLKCQTDACTVGDGPSRPAAASCQVVDSHPPNMFHDFFLPRGQYTKERAGPTLCEMHAEGCPCEQCVGSCKAIDVVNRLGL